MSPNSRHSPDFPDQGSRNESEMPDVAQNLWNPQRCLLQANAKGSWRRSFPPFAPYLEHIQGSSGNNHSHDVVGMLKVNGEAQRCLVPWADMLNHGKVAAQAWHTLSDEKPKGTNQDPKVDLVIPEDIRTWLHA